VTQNKSIPILPVSPQITAAREKWTYTGEQRPDFAVSPEPGQVSVWDFPRPPLLQPCPVPLRVVFTGKTGEVVIAETARALRVIETAGAPTYYFPPEDVDHSVLAFGDMSSVCEWKGVAQTITVAGQPDAAWRYIRMFEEFAELHEWIAFYPSKLDCYFGNERVSPQPGGFYGGWVTQSLAGPIKGEPNSSHW